MKYCRQIAIPLSITAALSACVQTAKPPAKPVTDTPLPQKC